MPGSCALANHGRYAVRHNPWTYFTRERAACRKHDRPMSAFVSDVRSGRLPRAGMVVPNLCHDAHDHGCDLGTADAWFQSVMGRVFRGPDWKAGRLAVVLTADEDDRTDGNGNRVLTTVIHPSQRRHVVTTPLNHYSLTRLYDEVAGLPYLHRAASAPSMARAFRLPVR
jgi:acid phosphatase